MRAQTNKTLKPATGRKGRFTLNLWTDDMGTFVQPGCRGMEDALWHVNSARDHDGLKSLTLEEFDGMARYPTSSARVQFTTEN